MVCDSYIGADREFGFSVDVAEGEESEEEDDDDSEDDTEMAA